MRVTESMPSPKDGETVYTPADMFYVIQLERHERVMLYEFKKRFGGTTEWKVKP